MVISRGVVFNGLATVQNLSQKDTQLELNTWVELKTGSESKPESIAQSSIEENESISLTPPQVVI